LLGSFVVSLQPPPELLELATELPTLDAALLEAPPAPPAELAVEPPPAPPALDAELLTLEAAPPAPPTPEVVPLVPPTPPVVLLTLEAALLEAALPEALLVPVGVASVTTTDPHAVGPSMAAAVRLAARLANQARSRDGILINPVLDPILHQEGTDHATELAVRGPEFSLH
jgi:hypothetical protein